MSIGKASFFLAAFIGAVFVLWEFVLFPMLDPAHRSFGSRACNNEDSAPLVRITACSARIGPNDPPSEGLAATLCARGTAYLQNKEPEKAMADFDRVLAMYPSSSCGNLGRGRLLYEQKKFDEARIALDKAVEADIYYTRTWVQRGRIRLEMGDREGAVADFRKALSIDPASTAALRELKKLGLER